MSIEQVEKGVHSGSVSERAEVTKPDDLSSAPVTYMAEEKTKFYKLFSDLHMRAMAFMHAHTQNR